MIYPIEEVWADIDPTWLGDAVRAHVAKIITPELSEQLSEQLSEKISEKIRAEVTAEVTAEVRADVVREVLRARFPGADDADVRRVAARLVSDHQDHAAGAALTLTADDLREPADA